MIPAWSALPLWLKIILFPILLSSIISICLAAIWGLMMCLAGIGSLFASIPSVRRYMETGKETS